MSTQPYDVFLRYPQLSTLKGKVSDELVQREVSEKAPRFEHYAALARQSIAVVKLGELFGSELERGRVVLENFLGQWGNVTVEELCKIALIVAWLRPTTILEIGTYNGLTTLQMAMNAPGDCQIFTLDILPALAASLEIGDIDSHLARKMGAFQVEVGHYFHGTPFARRITQLWGDSAKFDFQCYAGKIDFVFVDAGHTYDYIRADTENALRMVRSGGVILWHDYFQLLHPDVTQCLYEFAKDGLQIRHLRGTNLAVYRAT